MQYWEHQLGGTIIWHSFDTNLTHWVSSNLSWFASLNNKAFGNLFCNPEKSFFVNANAIVEFEEWSIASIIRVGRSRRGVKTLLWITEYITKSFVIHYEGFELSHCVKIFVCQICIKTMSNDGPNSCSFYLTWFWHMPNICEIVARAYWTGSQNRSILTAGWSMIDRAVASLTFPGGQEFHFPQFFLKFWSIFPIFPQTLLIFFLILALRVGESPTREGPGYATDDWSIKHSEQGRPYWTHGHRSGLNECVMLRNTNRYTNRLQLKTTIHWSASCTPTKLPVYWLRQHFRHENNI